MKKKKTVIILVIALAVFLILDIALIKSGNKDKNNATNETNEVESTDLYPEAIDDYDISTSYGNLVFPEEWNEYIKTEVVTEGKTETIQFYVEMEGKEKVHVFDIIFGGTGYEIGVIKNNDGKEVVVCIESYSYELDDTWTDAEKDILSSVEHDINYLLENLTNLENYTPIV